MKLPAFWPDAAEVWFAQADTQFAIGNVSVSKTKFYHAVAVLPQDLASQSLDLIRTPLARYPYEVLRKCFIMLYIYPEWLSAFWGSGLSSSLRRSEALASNEQDVGSPSRWLQAGFHPLRTVSLKSSNWCSLSSSPRESIGSSSLGSESRWTLLESGLLLFREPSLWSLRGLPPGEHNFFPCSFS